MTQSTQGSSDGDYSQFLCNEGTTPVMGPILDVASVYGPNRKVKQVTHVHLRRRGKEYLCGAMFSCSASRQRCLRMRKEDKDQEEVGNRIMLS